MEKKDRVLQGRRDDRGSRGQDIISGDRRVKGSGILEYLKKGWTESWWTSLARFRLAKEARKGIYWRREEE